MNSLPVRRLLIDLETPFPGRWNGGDAFRSALFNALSMSFPVGEQFFIDSVRAGLKALPESQRQQFAAEVRAFVGQEATHRHVHALFNGHLARLGYVNRIEQRARQRIEKNAGNDLRNHLGATAATEHLTAIMADWLLRHGEVFDGTEARLKTMWLWHCAEESEHRSTAFDIYGAAGGNQRWRLRSFYYVTLHFLWDVSLQVLLNLRHDGSLWRWSTWRSAARVLFAKDGLVRGNVRRWLDYRAPGFHPSQHAVPLAQRWLLDNTSQFTVVGPAQA